MLLNWTGGGERMENHGIRGLQLPTRRVAVVTSDLKECGLVWKTLIGDYVVVTNKCGEHF
jgi:hypothetical protein